MRISILTGKRGGFGAMVPLINELLQSGFLIEIIMTDQHLDPRFGSTFVEVEENFRARCSLVPIPLNQKSDSTNDRSKAMAALAEKLNKHFTNYRPDFVLVYGDRNESLTCAVVSTHLHIPIIHIQGGDKSGSIDDWMRHAITKLSHIHYPSTHESKKRILKMGEEEWRVEVVGDSHLDPIIMNDFASENELANKYEINLEKPFLLVLQHSETTNPHSSGFQMMETLSAVSNYKEFNKILIYPCSDVGFESVIARIEELRGKQGYFIFRNLDARYFRTLLKSATLLIGNSSSGLIEAPSLGTPTINVGRRQEGRLRGTSVFDSAHDQRAITEAISKALTLPKVDYFDSPYAVDLKETSAKRIVKHLQSIMYRPDLFVKRFCD